MNCPSCKSEKVREIIYGDVGFSSEAEEADFNKKFIEGGLLIPGVSPKFHCDNCGQDFETIGVVAEKKHINDGTRRKDIKPGIKVAIVLKMDQPTGKLTEGTVKDILTSSGTHHQGIKVRLTDGQVGRVQKML